MKSLKKTIALCAFVLLGMFLISFASATYDLGVYDSGDWYIKTLDDHVISWDVGEFGYRGAIPVQGDYDGDGIFDQALYDERTGKWYIRDIDGNVMVWASPGDSEGTWGGLGGKAVSGDFDGDGADDLAIFYKYGELAGNWYITSLTKGIITWKQEFGWEGAVPVSGDFDGDGTHDLAVYHKDNGEWYILNQDNEVLAWKFDWGYKGGVPVSGDYDGDGSDDLAIYDITTGYWYIYSLARGVILWNDNWGFKGGVAVSGDFNGDGIYDQAVYNKNTGEWFIKTLDNEVIAWYHEWGYKGGIAFAGVFSEDDTTTDDDTTNTDDDDTTNDDTTITTNDDDDDTDNADTTAPSSISSLEDSSVTENSISWTWSNPSDSDFDTALVYLDGVNVASTTSGSYSATGLASDTTYTLTIFTMDDSGNVNWAGVSDIVTTLDTPTADTTAPASVTNLIEDNVTSGSITWTWTNPSDSDFASTLVYIDGNNTANITDEFHTTIGFPNTSYTITLYTMDTSGNVNWAGVSDMATTLDNGSSTTPSTNDTTAPASVTNLEDADVDDDSILWNWNNPTDSDFSLNLIYLNGINVANTTGESYRASGLDEDTTYTITVYTMDNSSNINWVGISDSVTTDEEDDDDEDDGNSNIRWGSLLGYDDDGKSVIYLEAVEEIKSFDWALALIIIFLVLIVITSIGIYRLI